MYFMLEQNQSNLQRCSTSKVLWFSVGGRAKLVWSAPKFTVCWKNWRPMGRPSVVIQIRNIMYFKLNCLLCGACTTVSGMRVEPWKLNVKGQRTWITLQFFCCQGQYKAKKRKARKNGRLIQQRAHNRQKEQTLNKGADTDIQLLECKLSVLLFPSVAAAYITHVPHVQQLYFLLSRGKCDVAWLRG